MSRNSLRPFVCAALALTVAGCGGGGGGGGGASSTINGDVATASTAAVAADHSSWLARWVAPLLPLPRRALAVGTDTSLEGIEVTAESGNDRSIDVTDSAGGFAIGEAPIGNVQVTFRRGGCSAATSLPDVVAGGVVTITDVAFDCSSARPGKVSEAFEAVVRSKPSSPNGNLNVCVTSGGGKRTRVVKVKDATFETASGGAASFADLEAGDRIRARGDREGLGSSSALDASLVTILGRDNDDCLGQASPTPALTETPEPTETPTLTPTP